MSLFRPRLGVRSVLAVTTALTIAACSDVRPLYEGGGTSLTSAAPQAYAGPVQTELSRIAVEPQSTRVSQRVRNDLLFRLGGGSTPSGTSDAAYRLTLRVQSATRDVLVRPEVNRPTGRHVTLTVSYNLFTHDGEEPLTSGTVQRIAAIEVSDQKFAAERAALDAENKASAEVADSLRTELASWFATRY